MWRRLFRSKAFILVAFMIVFSLGVLGQIDTRMHIGGSDWDLDNLIYINIDDYLEPAVEPAALEQTPPKTSLRIGPEQGDQRQDADVMKEITK